MRQYAVTLAANTGTSEVGPTLDLSGATVEIGPWSREAEKELTKVSPSEQTIRILDLDGSVWAWLQSQVRTTEPTTALYPPWVLIDVDGVREFTGFAFPRQITHDEVTGEISITAQDWSSCLASKYLGADDANDDFDPARNPWLRPYPRAAAARPATTLECTLSLKSAWSRPAQFDQVIWRGQQVFEAGDFVTTDLSSQIPGFPIGKQYKVSSVYQPYPAWVSDLWMGLFEGLGQDIWDHTNQLQTLAAAKSNFTRVAQPTSLRGYFLVTKSVADNASGVRAIGLDTVDGIAPGDTLVTTETTQGKSWTVLQVDAETKEVVTKEDVQGVIAGTTHLFFSQDSLQDLVLDDARTAIQRAVSLNSGEGATHYTVDFSRFIPPTVTNPVLVWLPLRAMGSKDLSTVRAMDQGLTDFRVYGADTAAWDGTPETGWGDAANVAPRAPWSAQLEAAPTSCMPNEAATLAPGSPSADLILSLAIRDRLTYNPAVVSVPSVNLVYDYFLMRRVLIRIDQTIAITPWTGTDWGSTINVTWPGSSPVLSASVFPDAHGSIIGLTTAGLVLVSLPDGAVSNLVAIPADAKDGVLRTTPWGCYLVGSQGYGRITLTAGSLVLNWVTVADQVKSFFPTTFQALDATELMVMARFEGTASDSSELVTETHLLRLRATPPEEARNAVIATEKIIDGAPRTAIALRDAAHTRIIGHCGGRLFVFGRTLPAAYAIERYTPSGLKAMELIEHVCQVLNAIAVPDPLGCLHIISRGLHEDPIDLQVDRTELTETTTWEHFYSVVRVSSAKDDAVLADAWGIKGGDSLEYAQHPFLWTQSGCSAVSESLAAWFGVPRGYREEKWFWTDVNSPAPWESLPPVASVRLNGESTKWVLLAIQDDKTQGEAVVKLVEVF